MQKPSIVSTAIPLQRFKIKLYVCYIRFGIRLLKNHNYIWKNQEITKNLLIILSLHNYQAQKLCAGILCHIVPVRSTLSPSLINVKSLQFLRNLTRFITIIKTEDIFGSKILPFPVRSTDQCALTHGVEYSNNHIAKIYLNHRRLRIFPILSLPH